MTDSPGSRHTKGHLHHVKRVELPPNCSSGLNWDLRSRSRTRYDLLRIWNTSTTKRYPDDITLRVLFGKSNFTTILSRALMFCFFIQFSIRESWVHFYLAHTRLPSKKKKNQNCFNTLNKLIIKWMLQIWLLSHQNIPTSEWQPWRKNWLHHFILSPFIENFSSIQLNELLVFSPVNWSS